MPNALITEFYSAFQRLDAEAMAACYTDDVVFSDPAFGELRGRDAGDMWRMLTTRAKDFSLTFDHVRSDDTAGEMRIGWRTYLFSATGNTVVNDIGARFVFRDGQDLSTPRPASTCRALVAPGVGHQGPVAGLVAGLGRCRPRQARKGLKAFRPGVDKIGAPLACRHDL